MQIATGKANLTHVPHFKDVYEQEVRSMRPIALYTVFPQIRPGIIFLQGLQMRVLLERGY